MLSAEYDFMRPPQHKTAEAVAFISNCGAQSFRLDAVRQLSQVPTIIYSLALHIHSHSEASTRKTYKACNHGFSCHSMHL